MVTGASIATIKAALVTVYQAIDVPALDTITAVPREADSEPTSLPFVEIYTNPTQRIVQEDEDSYLITRRFIVRLYVAPLPDDTPSIEYPDYVKAENCIEPIEDYFYFTDDRLGRTAGVEDVRFEADTAGVMLYTRANQNYVGVAFNHTITYRRER